MRYIICETWNIFSTKLRLVFSKSLDILPMTPLLLNDNYPCTMKIKIFCRQWTVIASGRNSLEQRLTQHDYMSWLPVWTRKLIAIITVITIISLLVIIISYYKIITTKWKIGESSNFGKKSCGRCFDCMSHCVGDVFRPWHPANYFYLL